MKERQQIIKRVKIYKLNSEHANTAAKAYAAKLLNK